MPEFKISMPWKEASGREGRVEQVISALESRDHYGEFRGEGEVQTWERHARISAHNAASIVAFMDATGLEICHEFARIFGEHYRMPDGADHTRGWQMRAEVGGRYFATTEPYGEGYKAVETWCAASGWPYRTFPVGVGLWFPAAQGTRLIFMAPPAAADAFPALAEAIGQRLPVWNDD
jgi:hypothetical protein